MNSSERYKQHYQVCLEMMMENGNISVFHIQEFEVYWPKDKNKKDLYEINLVGSKALFPREKETIRLFYPNINKAFDINGSKLGLNDDVVLYMPNSDQWKITNECTFANVYEYRHMG